MKTKAGSVTVELGRPNSEPQEKFFASRVKYICFGGARGGGKSWCTQRKSVGGCLRYPGLRVLILRRRYEDLENSVIEPILKLVNRQTATFHTTKRMLEFCNGSYIRFGNMESYDAAVSGKYQGQEYDWIFLEEATLSIMLSYTASSSLRLRPKQSSAPHLMKFSTARLFSSPSPIRWRKSSRDLKGPPSARLAAMERMRPRPTFLTAPKPKRMASPSTVK